MTKKIYFNKTPNGTFRVRFIDENGRWWSKTFKTKTDAQIFERAVKRDEPLGFWFPENQEEGIIPASFAILAEQWLDHGKHVRELSKSCLDNYKTHLNNHILPVLGDFLVKDLKLADIELLAKALKIKKPMTRSYQSIRKNHEECEEDAFLSLGYRREILIVACMITRWARERNLIQVNPFDRYKLPVKAEQPYDYWRLEDEDSFFDWIEQGGNYTLPVKSPYGNVFDKPMKVRNSEELRDIVLFALRSGMRLGEIGGLRNRDVNLSEGWVRIRSTYSFAESRIKNSTKNKKYRLIEMNADMREILWRRRHIPEGKPVFNVKMNTIKFFSRTCRWAGVREIHFHALSHTCLTNLANGYGMDKPLPVTQVQKIAGHADIKMTQRYVHTHGIEGTGSGQWSREERLARKKQEEVQSTTTSFSGEEEHRMRSLHFGFASSRDDRPKPKKLRLIK